MPKSIWFPDSDFEQLVELARECGFRVSRGRGSQLRQFVMMAANKACTLTAEAVPSNQADPGDKPDTTKKASPRRRR